MSTFDVTILGCSSATPAYGRNPTSQIVQFLGSYFLIDCGEAAQMQMRRFSIKFQRIHHIFISHLHGDHFLGLPGLLSSMSLLGRTEPVHIYAEKGLKDILDTTNLHARVVLRFPIVFHPLNAAKEELLYEDKNISIHSFLMKHSIPCCGFLFHEKERPVKLIKEQLTKYNVPIEQMESLKQGKDFTMPDGRIIPNSELAMPPLPSRKYAYCSDTVYFEEVIPFITHADLLYHEATFQEDMQTRARQTMHCTAKEAAAIALKAEVNKLIIGHFSARYKDLSPLLEEAKQVFPNTVLAEEGMKYSVGI